MVVVYFSGTGNTRHLAKLLASRINSQAVSIEDNDAYYKISISDEIVFAFPVYSSGLPEIVRNFIDNNGILWNKKNIFIFVTAGMMYGPSIGIAACLLKSYGANILGSEFFKMPDCIGDVKLIVTLLPRRKNPQTILKSDSKMVELATKIINKEYPQVGLSIKLKPNALEKHSSSLKPKIDLDKCNNCRLCRKTCPSPDKCTQCYRCFSICPRQAITIMGKKVFTQYLYDDDNDKHLENVNSI
ncbi:MAG: EFR1 family ferrodoxin [Acholeplasmatales bacterium]|jgi:ferredoxin|nr:EFR1 family ferrodoxin [Acholeplasmatales bacterium]